MIIGLTGGIATGKSTVAELLADLGASIIDADQIAHNILEKDKKAYYEVLDFFGVKILNRDGSIDRAYLGELVFSERKKLEKLEKITHPYIIKEINEEIASRENNYENIVLDAPLLFETELDKIVDQVWVVYAEYEVQINRIMQRDSLPKDEAEKRIKSQMPLKKKMDLADQIVFNKGSLQELQNKVIEKWEKIIQN